MKVGDKVEILSKLGSFWDRKIKTGGVTAINGEYIIVRPSWWKRTIELYPCALRLL